MRLVRKDENTYYLASPTGNRVVKAQHLERFLNQSMMISKLAAKRLIKAADERYKQQKALGVLDAAESANKAG